MACNGRDVDMLLGMTVDMPAATPAEAAAD
jgi:hypothetical protein